MSTKEHIIPKQYIVKAICKPGTYRTRWAPEGWELCDGHNNTPNLSYLKDQPIDLCMYINNGGCLNFVDDFSKGYEIACFSKL